MDSENHASPIAPVTVEIPDNRQYRVDVASGHEGCIACGHDAFYTVTYEDTGERVEIGQSWMDADLADDICDLMNDAYAAGKEAAVANGEAKPHA